MKKIKIKATPEQSPKIQKIWPSQGLSWAGFNQKCYHIFMNHIYI